MRIPVLVFCLLALCVSACSVEGATMADPGVRGSLTGVTLNTQQAQPAAVNTRPPAATMTKTLANPTPVRPTPTPPPKNTPTAVPTRFDRSGYRQFAITRSYFPGLDAYADGRQYTERYATLSPDGSLVALAGCWGSVSNLARCDTLQSGFLIVLRTDTGKLVQDIPLGQGWAVMLDFSADGKNLLFGTHEQKVLLWNLSSNQPAQVFYNRAASGSVRYPDVAAAPDGKSYAAVINGALFAWNPAGEVLFQAEAFAARSAVGLSYAADGSHLVVLAPNRAGVDVYRTSDWTLVRRLTLRDVAHAVLSPDGTLVAGIDSLNQSVLVWNVSSGEKVAQLTPGHRVSHAQFNPAGDLLVLTGLGNLDERDGYSMIGSLYETQSWKKLDDLVSFSDYGKVEFSQDGSRMAVLSGAFTTIWGLPDQKLTAGLDVARRFQAALHAQDYAAAAALFAVDEQDVEYLSQQGVDVKDLAGSFKRLCDDGTMFCYPVQELVVMGYDWEYMVYLVRLAGPGGQAFKSPQGATLIYIYLINGKDGKPKISDLPFD